MPQITVRPSKVYEFLHNVQIDVIYLVDDDDYYY